MKKLFQILYLSASMIGVTPAHAEIIKGGEFSAHISKDTVICKQAKDILNLNRLVDEDDEAAFTRLLNEYAKHAECAGLAAGTKVIAEQFESDPDNPDIAALCVRRKGFPFCAWTSPATVERDND